MSSHQPEVANGRDRKDEGCGLSRIDGISTRGIVGTGI